MELYLVGWICRSSAEETGHPSTPGFRDDLQADGSGVQWPRATAEGGDAGHRNDSLCALPWLSPALYSPPTLPCIARPFAMFHEIADVINMFDKIPRRSSRTAMMYHVWVSESLTDQKAARWYGGQ